METYKHSRSSVGSNRKHIQLTPKYRYEMMRQEKLKVFCKVAIEEACKRHDIVVEIIKVMSDHVHMIADVPRTMTDAQALQIIKGLLHICFFESVRICERDIHKDIFGMQDIFVMESETVILQGLIVT